MASRTKPAGGSTVDEAEVVRFSARAAEWWDPRGEMAMLHRFNPVRLAFIKQAACRQFGREEPRLVQYARGEPVPALENANARGLRPERVRSVRPSARGL